MVGVAWARQTRVPMKQERAAAGMGVITIAKRTFRSDSTEVLVLEMGLRLKEEAKHSETRTGGRARQGSGAACSTELRARDSRLRAREDKNGHTKG